MKNVLILILLSFSVYSCSNFYGTRSIAEVDVEVVSGLNFFEPNEKTSELLEQVADVEKLDSFLQKEIDKINLWVKQSAANYEVKFTKVKLEDGVLAKVVPEINGDKLIVQLKITPEGLKNPFVVMEELIHLYQITNAPISWGKFKNGFNSYVHAYHWAEVVWNAGSGSKVAEAQLARNKMEAALANQDAFETYSPLLKGSNREIAPEYFEKRLAQAQEDLLEKTKVAKKFLSEAQKKFEARKVIFDELEDNAEKFDDLVAKNDRKGVKKLLENYLPWELMEPSEKTSWINWLDAMEKPIKANRQLVFRGMYDDVIHKNEEKEVYLFSTLINKNQGNYNRRLRSLTTFREKPFSIKYLRLNDREIPYITKGVLSSSITTMMYNHSVEALGSPFLSTANLDVAMKFGPRQLGAFLIDERRLMPNPLPDSKYTYQHERLVPLVIFPDEVVHFHDYKADDQGISIVKPEIRKAHFKATLEKKLGRAITKEEASGYKSNGEFLDYGFKRLKNLFTPSRPTAGCLVLMEKFL